MNIYHFYNPRADVCINWKWSSVELLECGLSVHYIAWNTKQHWHGNEKGVRNPLIAFLIPSHSPFPNLCLFFCIDSCTSKECRTGPEEKKIIISQWFLQKEGSIQGMQKRPHNEDICISEVRRSIDNLRIDLKQPNWIKPYREMKINKTLFCYVNKKRTSEEAGLMCKCIQAVLI